MPVAGAYPLTAVAKLPNVDIASPGEVWTNARANGVVIPGAAVAPVNVSGKMRLKQLIVGDTPDINQVGVALRQVEVPDVNTGPSALGPNEVGRLVERRAALGHHDLRGVRVPRLRLLERGHPDRPLPAVEPVGPDDSPTTTT
jgi:hypothetical protein